MAPRHAHDDQKRQEHQEHQEQQKQPENQDQGQDQGPARIGIPAGLFYPHRPRGGDKRKKKSSGHGVHHHQPGVTVTAHGRIPESHVRMLPAGTAPPESTFAPRNDFNVLAAEAYQQAAFAFASAPASASASGATGPLEEEEEEEGAPVSREMLHRRDGRDADADADAAAESRGGSGGGGTSWEAVCEKCGEA